MVLCSFRVATVSSAYVSTGDMSFEPSYLQLLESGDLRNRAEEAHRRLEQCMVCPHACGVNRLKGELGTCQTGELAVVSSYGPHFGEEAPLVGDGGSGTVFFGHCNLRCQFCQNYEISQLGEGGHVEPEALAEIFLHLQTMGCSNINLVSPTHVVPQILAALLLATQAGLSLPLVYNTGGYDALETLRLLDSVVDIYMPDMKYADAAIAQRYSRATDYPRINRAAVREMHRQVGDLELDARGLARRGLLVRHLVLPDGLAGSQEIARFLAESVSADTYVNAMDQYRPCYKAREHPPLDRRITAEEYRAAVEAFGRAGLHRLDDRGKRWVRHRI
jgi:putative pyruvate formate lyase activating enzyme